jgi:hypothetical protein
VAATVETAAVLCFQSFGEFLRWNSHWHAIVLPGGSSKKRESLAQYLARPPISLGKVSFESFHEKVLFHTSYSEYFKENLKLFSAGDFIALLTQHIPPKGVQYLRRYGLYSSRGRGTCNRKPYVIVHAPEGWKRKHAGIPDSHGKQQIPDADPPSLVSPPVIRLLTGYQFSYRSSVNSPAINFPISYTDSNT